MTQLLRNAISLWITNRPLLYALASFAKLLIASVQAKSAGGKYITAAEWDKAAAAGRAAYEAAAVRAGWRNDS